MTLRPVAEESDDKHTPLLPSSGVVPTGAMEENETSSATIMRISLSQPLRFLFGLNGVTLSLPILAYLYIVNTRAAVPLAFLSAYGAIAFVPFSFKPLYACYFSKNIPRVQLLTFLLAMNGISVAATALVPRGGVVWCFLLAFLRGVTCAWPEFLLGLTLIDEAAHRGGVTTTPNSLSYQEAAAVFQSQAATARNFGSLLAHVFTFVIFANQYFAAESHPQLNETMATFLLVITGALTIVGAIVASWSKVGASCEDDRPVVRQMEDSTRTSGLNTERDVLSLSSSKENPTNSNAAVCFPGADSRSNVCSFLGREVVLVALFQITIIIFAIRGPIINFVSAIAWDIVMLLLVMALVLSTLLAQPVQWKLSHRVGIFLIVKHAIPTASYLMESYVFWLFQSKPILLQLLSLSNMAATTLASWSYGRILAKFSAGWSLIAVIAATTCLASVVSLGNIALARSSWIAGHTDGGVFLLVVLINVLTSFTTEWKFLPSVVLATGSVTLGQSAISPSITLSKSDEALVPLISDEDQHQPTYHLGTDDDSCAEMSRSYMDTTGMQYGILISCIDFGDQIGSWLTVPLVTALGISREHNWANLDTMIFLCCIGGMLSLAFLLILPRPTTR